VLIAQWPEGKTLKGLWELPGGKLKPSERGKAIIRD
jgi:8-oxo-dGTP pyrophosphatase MutT (NUDIX family)